MKRLAVLGHPVAHSRSPEMHTKALAELGLAGQWRYERIDVTADKFEARVREMAAEDFVGANVTIPHKEAALALADLPKREALAIGAANTLVFTAEGIEAHNTDAGGLLDALPSLPGGRRALVLGAGGAARAAIWALTEGGAVVDVLLGVDVWNRTPSRAEAVVAELGGAVVDSPRLSTYGLIVNTTAVGLEGENPFEHLPLAEGGFDSEQVVVDMVYGDSPSGLIEAARAADAHIVDGIEILVRQGARSLKIWTGHEAPLETMLDAARG
jgi:shikimate dehydrogenase